MSNYNYKKGFTLIELLVVIFIIGILAAISIPGIMAVREQGRRITCSNNLRQIGIAIANYASAHQSFPTNAGVFSPIARLLPYIESQNLANLVNVNIHTESDMLTISLTNISALMCPSDNRWIKTGMTNYCLNGGMENQTNAPFSSNPNINFLDYRDIQDGLSTTAFVSEWLTGDNSVATSSDSLRQTYKTAVPRIKSSEFDSFCRDCYSASNAFTNIIQLTKGSSWIESGFGATSYNHALLPFGPSCTNGTLLQYGAFSATSGHTNAVHVLFGDSHVASIKKNITLATWRSLGTMNGGEISQTSD